MPCGQSSAACSCLHALPRPAQTACTHQLKLPARTAATSSNSSLHKLRSVVRPDRQEVVAECRPHGQMRLLSGRCTAEELAWVCSLT